MPVYINERTVRRKKWYQLRMHALWKSRNKWRLRYAVKKMQMYTALYGTMGTKDIDPGMIGLTDVDIKILHSFSLGLESKNLLLKEQVKVLEEDLTASAQAEAQATHNWIEAVEQLNMLKQSMTTYPVIYDPATETFTQMVEPESPKGFLECVV